jgi:hypothetical protein
MLKFANISPGILTDRRISSGPAVDGARTAFRPKTDLKV